LNGANILQFYQFSKLEYVKEKLLSLRTQFFVDNMISFCICLSILVLGYFIYGNVVERIFGIDKQNITPANRLQDGVDFIPMNWIILIFVYYILATLLPIDKIIGTIYPIFGAFLLLMGIGLLFSIFIYQPQLPEFWDGLQNTHPYAKSHPIFPIMFITIACGAVSGFHSTQSTLMSRCITNEKQGKPIFFGAMITAWLNQFLAMVTLWASSIFLVIEKKFYLITLIPAIFMTMVTTSFLFIAQNEGFGLLPLPSFLLGGTITLFFTSLFYHWKYKYQKNNCI
jgi:carbon starvation protein CstA